MVATPGVDVRFVLLGPIEAWYRDRPVPVGRPRQRAVLAYLLLSANKLVTNGSLIEGMWRGAAPATAHAQIRADVAAIRRAFRQVGAPDPIVTAHMGYRVTVQPGQLDLNEFTDDVKRARAMLDAPDIEPAARLLRTALARWRGPALGAAGGAFLDSARANLEEQRLAAYEELAEVELRLGREADVVAELSALVREHPLRERLGGCLMVALYRSGRQGDALAVARQLRRDLADGLGLDPGPRIVELERQVLRADQALDGPRRAGLGGTEPTRAHRDVPAQLPPAVSDFVGRDGQLEWLGACVDAMGPEYPGVAAPLVVITGIAGVGKTALAVRWAHLVRDRFADGQLFVDLRGYSPGAAMSPLAALTLLLGALGVPGDQVPATVEEATAVYRTRLAGREVLIIIDNGLSPDQIRPLLPGNPGCLTLVTSRDRLSGLVARDGAHRLELDVLPATESTTLIARILGPARRAAEPQASAELAELCGHLPLALRIAATQLADTAHRRIAEHVAMLRAGDRLAEFEIEGDSQTSITAAFHLSYQTLGAPSRRLFRLLSLVPGDDFTAAAAGELLDAPAAQASRLLGKLAGAHLVSETTPERFAFHDLLRLYAGTRAAAEEAEVDRRAALGRLFDFYLHMIDLAAAQLYPQMLRLPRQRKNATDAMLTSHDTASEWLDAERANLVSAVVRASEQGANATAVALADALRGYFFTRGYPADWTTVALAGMAAAELDGSPDALTAARMNLAQLYRYTGQHDEALRQHTEALTHAEAAGWAQATSATLGNLGTVYAERGQLRESLDCFSRALAINRKIVWRHGEAVNLVNLGLSYRQRGELDQAAEHYRLANDLYVQLGAHAGEAIVQTNMGEVSHALGKLTAAREHLERALTLHREFGNRANEGETLRCLAALDEEMGAIDEALRRAETAVEIARETGYWHFEINARATYASIQRRIGAHGLALDTQLAALRESRLRGYHHLTAEILIGLTTTLHDVGYPGQAVELAEEALAVAERSGYRPLEGGAHRALAMLQLSGDNVHGALAHASKAVERLRRTGHRPELARALMALGQARERAGDIDGSWQSLAEASDLFAAIGVPEKAECDAKRWPAVSPANHNGRARAG